MGVSESPANHWAPALAAAPDGTVWVGWDGYDRGNYDVYVRAFRGGSPGPVQQITHSPRFHANVTLAADAQSNLWIAFDEAEVNWGKDYGTLVKDEGAPCTIRGTFVSFASRTGGWRSLRSAAERRVPAGRSGLSPIWPPGDLKRREAGGGCHATHRRQPRDRYLGRQRCVGVGRIHAGWGGMETFSDSPAIRWAARYARCCDDR